ncbi:MAG: lytic murein transglycosylase B [Rehaibacterium terrae]|uniref:lytic murein transglycosylase B n=1 Tax=Rehaibacterium terrae TaxID=1341696 RepID=UPI00391D3922
MNPLRLLPAFALCLALPAAADEARRAFVDEVVKTHGVERAKVEAMLGEARYRQSIIDAITRPAEARPWKAYRPIFLTDRRIADGRAFLAEHREALARVEAETGVPAALIVAILGVETSYGRITGSHRVIDALYTLGFHYPPRQSFFRSELAHLFALANEEGLDIPSLMGSYAGAMGWGQFMPSSYRAYAKDGDGDGRRDLFGSLPDVFASVANYFVAHGWEPGQPVAVRAQVAADAESFVAGTLEPKFEVAELSRKGYVPEGGIGHDKRATLVTLEGDAGPEHWIGFRNFYVITRYNRSPLYAMAVHQLAEAIAAGEGGRLAP